MVMRCHTLPAEASSHLRTKDPGSAAAVGRATRLALAALRAVAVRGSTALAVAEVLEALLELAEDALALAR